MSVKPFTPESFQTFGDLLKYLRRRERLTQLELSIMVGYSEAQIGRLEKNQRRPELTALKALFIHALHLEDEPELTARFLELAQSARQDDAPGPGYAPYKGLLFFDEADADLFFGREALTAHLADRVAGISVDRSTRLLAVVGASGSGKSSLVRAGLAVALKRSGWAVRVFTPGTSPLKALETQLELPTESDYLLILVDQFEEVFTLCHDESERVLFIEKLLTLAQGPSQKVNVVIALRADFYSHCAQYSLLRNAVAAQQEYIGQMTTDELRRAIEEPAKRGGWDFEPGLVNVLLQDIGIHGSSEPEPGALPLLSHALLATWERRRGRTFTLEDYHAIGGVRGAIAETAEGVFTDQLNQQQQELARDVFLRLTELGEGTEDTRRRAALNELVHQSSEAAQLRGVLNTLAEARLITLNEDSAEVAHEALIREWQRLHEWLTSDRDGLRLHRHLTDSAHEWELRNRDASELYRGARLAQAREWAGANDERLNESERAFLNASIKSEQHDALEREAQRQRELEASRNLAETKSQSEMRLRGRNRIISAVGIVALLLAVLASVFGFNSSQNAQQALNAQATSQVDAQSRATAEANAVAERNLAQQQSLIASAREIVGSANFNLDIDPELSLLLALQAVKLNEDSGQPTLVEVKNALHQAVQASRVEFTLKDHTAEVMGLAYSPDGKLLATVAADKTIRIWDTANGKSIMTIPTGDDYPNLYRAIRFSPDGKQIAGAAFNNQAKIWDVASGKELLVLQGHDKPVFAAVFSHDGKWLATSSLDQTTRIWDTNTGNTVLTLTTQITQDHRGGNVAFSPDDKYLAAPDGPTDAVIWDIASGQALHRLSVFDGALGFAFSPDGKTLATGSYNNTWNLWEVATGKKLLTGTGHGSLVTSIAFDIQGAYIATASVDGTAKIWDAATGEELLNLAGHKSGLISIAFSPDGSHVATASQDGTAKIWNVSLAGRGEWLNLIGHTGRIWWVDYSPNGKYIATAGFDGVAKLWDAATGKDIYTFGGFNDGPFDVSFSPDSKRLVVTGAHGDGFAKIYDTGTGKELLTIPTNAESMVFSPDGLYLATADVNWDKNGNVTGPVHVIILDAQTGKEQFALPGEFKDSIGNLIFSQDGKRLVAFSKTLIMWDLETRRQILDIDTTGVNAAISPDSKLLATGGGNDALIHIWDAATGKELYTLQGHKGTTFGVTFNPDGHYLASTSTDKTVKIWNVIDNFVSEPLTLHGHTATVYRVAFSPDGKRLVTASRDGTARVYALDLNDLIAIALSRLTRTLMTQECQQYLHVNVCPALP